MRKVGVQVRPGLQVRVSMLLFWLLSLRKAPHVSCRGHGHLRHRFHGREEVGLRWADFYPCSSMSSSDWARDESLACWHRFQACKVPGSTLNAERLHLARAR